METTTDANGVAAFAATEMVSTFSTTALEEYVDFLITVVKAGYETATVNYSDFPATTALTTNSDVVMSVPASNTATVSVTVTGDATVEVNGAVQNSATVDVEIRAEGSEKEIFKEIEPYIHRLAKVNNISYAPMNAPTPPKSASAVVSASKLIVPLADLIDLDEEIKRQEKKLQR